MEKLIGFWFAAIVKTMRSLSVIAAEIRKDWKKPYFGAVPYLEAMSQMVSIKDKFIYDSGESIVLYFLSLMLRLGAERQLKESSRN